jgi:hypothetical protein
MVQDLKDGFTDMSQFPGDKTGKRPVLITQVRADSNAGETAQKRLRHSSLTPH